MERQHPDRQQILDMAGGFRPACLLGAAAELDLFSLLETRALSADELSRQLQSDRRATRILLDALAALGLLEKGDAGYRLPAELAPLLSQDSPETILPMIRLTSNTLRGWSQLAWVVKAGIPAPRPASIRGPAADREAFVAAMHVVSQVAADKLVEKLGPPKFKHLLDVGGASGTWTLALLRAAPGAKATIFDLPDAIEQARQRLARTDLAERVELVSGDFYKDHLPGSADFAWVSAIAHQHSRKHNRELFAKVYAALQPLGRIAVRDVVMEPSRTEPLFGAMFAVNMLVNTATGGTFTFQEFAEDLKSAGFAHPQLLVKDEVMNSVVVAEKSLV